MKRVFVSMLVAAAAFSFTSAAIGGSVVSLRGDHELTDPAQAPEKRKVEVVQGGIERSYKEQPPMIPHEVEKYEVTLKQNGCLKCHSEATFEKEKAPKVGDSHFIDRDGKKLDSISMRRYFCEQCHAPQLSGEPLVENAFQGRK